MNSHAGRAVAGWAVVAALAAGTLASCSADAADAPRGPALRLVTVAKGLESPVQVVNDGRRLFVVEQPGRIRQLDGGKVAPKPFLDVKDHVTFQGECGFLGVAFHPDFARNGYFYVDYTTGRGSTLRTVISEFHAQGADAAAVDPKTERILLEIKQPYPNHNGGQVVFGPDGMLYIGMGDGGSANDPENRAQNPKELLGKILRIDVNQRDPYGIPKDNPFVADARFRPEIWTLGMRNPWRFSFARATGTCFAGDVGQNSYEEIDVITKGGNYGWHIREAMHPFRQNETPPVTPLIDPIAEYGRDKGQSVTGGVVYRGKKFPSLTGIYF